MGLNSYCLFVLLKCRVFIEMLSLSLIFIWFAIIKLKVLIFYFIYREQDSASVSTRLKTKIIAREQIPRMKSV